MTEIAQNGEPMMTGDELKEVGITRVLENTNPDWIQNFCRMAAELLQSEGSFTSEEITAHIGMPDGNHNAIGGAMARLRKRFKLPIRVIGFEKSSRPQSRSRLIARWGWA
jgi:hypothetical protein